MTVGELMSGKTLNPNFEGIVTNDDNLLAVNIGVDGADVNSFAVAQMGIKGFDPQLNAETGDTQYMRSGKSTTKTGYQRVYTVEGDRYVGDAFQDFCFSHDVQYGVGQAVIKEYVYFNVITGKGEKGKVSIISVSDGSGESGENAGIEIELMQALQAPEEFVYTPA